MTDHFEQGHALYTNEPDLLLVEVWHRASFVWAQPDRVRFVEGYIAARRQRDRREQESRHD